MINKLGCYINLFRAKLKISNIEKEIENKSTYIVGFPFKHETTLIKIALIAPAALYYSLPKKERQETQFEGYLHMMANGLYSGDLEDTINDDNLSQEQRSCFEKIQEHFIEEAHILAKKYNLYKSFKDAESKSRAYQNKEANLTGMLEKKELSFIEQLFNKNSTLEHLSYDRIAVLYIFGVGAAFDIFLRNTSVNKYRKNVNMWAKYLSIALQEGYDDTNDLEEDLRDNRPTPIILRGIRTKLLKNEEIVWPISKDITLIKYGLTETKTQVNNYLDKIEKLNLPPLLKIITQKAKTKINSSFK